MVVTVIVVGRITRGRRIFQVWAPFHPIMVMGHESIR